MKPGTKLQWRYASGEIGILPDPERRVFDEPASHAKLLEHCPLASADLRKAAARGFVRWVEYGTVVRPDGPQAGVELLPAGACFMVTAPACGFDKMSDSEVLASLGAGAGWTKELEDFGQDVLA